MAQSNNLLLKRARGKYLSWMLANCLSEANPHSFLKRSYVASTECCSVLVQNGNKLTSTYCKNRWCAVCNRIRTAKLINGYQPILKEFGAPYFVTLTKRTVLGSDLTGSIKLMADTWRKILTSREGRKRRIKGIRKAECTIRPNGHYHYHFHVLVDGEDNAKWLIESWLKQLGNLADEKAQDVRIADEKSFKELFKYFTKLTVKGQNSLIDYKRMDFIFNALRGKRVYQSFGGVRPISEDIEEVQSQSYDLLDECEQVWNWEVNDWINEYGECLTGYQPSEKLMAYFKSEDIG